MKKQIVRFGLVIGTVALAGVCRAEGDVITTLSTTATGLITSAVTAVTAIVVAGFALVGIMWGARKIKAGIKSA